MSTSSDLHRNDGGDGDYNPQQHPFDKFAFRATTTLSCLTPPAGKQQSSTRCATVEGSKDITPPLPESARPAGFRCQSFHYASTAALGGCAQKRPRDEPTPPLCVRGGDRGAPHSSLVIDCDADTTDDDTDLKPPPPVDATPRIDDIPTVTRCNTTTTSWRSATSSPSSIPEPLSPLLLRTIPSQTRATTRLLSASLASSPSTAHRAAAAPTTTTTTTINNNTLNLRHASHPQPPMLRMSSATSVVVNQTAATNGDDEDEDDGGFLWVAPRSDRPAAAAVVVPPQRQVVKRRTDDDDDDADLMRGLAGIGHRTAVSASTTTTSSTAAAAAPALSSWPWKSVSPSERLSGLIEPMTLQLAHTLSHDQRLLDALRPFAHPKTLAKLLSRAPQRPKFDATPPLITERHATDDDEMVLRVVRPAHMLPQQQQQPPLQLRDYQREGVSFLLKNFLRGLPSILADDMGLGKTAQICAFLHSLFVFYNIPGPHLLIVPLSTLASWTKELLRWAPSLEVTKYHGNETFRRALQMDQRHTRFHVFVTTPSIFVRDRAFFKKKRWVCVMVDEAHILRGGKTSIATHCRQLLACGRIAVTGTPVHNRVQEVWNMMNFLFPMIGVERTSPQDLTNLHATNVDIEEEEAFVARTASMITDESDDENDDKSAAADGNGPSEEEEPPVPELSSKSDDTASLLHMTASGMVACAALLRFVMIRRTKDSPTLALGIPPRTDAPTILVNATPLQHMLFKRITDMMFSSADAVDGGDGEVENEAPQSKRSNDTKRLSREERLALYAMLARQRHLCNHPLTLKLLLGGGGQSTAVPLWAQPREVDGNDSKCKAPMTAGLERLCVAGIPLDSLHLLEASGKMKRLDELLTDLKQNDHRVLIFSNFTSTLDLIEGLCAFRQHSYERLDGSTSRVERELSMARFNHRDSKRFVFLLTTTAGGVGITLTGADTVVIFDAHYNPQLDRQAADRAHRLGQSRPVTIYRLCVKDSVEERIQMIANQKAMVGDAVVNGGRSDLTNHHTDVDVTKLIDANELRAMFQQLRKQQQTGFAEVPLSDDSSGEVDDKRRCWEALVAELMTLAALTKEERGWAMACADDDVAGRSDGRCIVLPHTHVCFPCGEKMKPLEPLLHCTACTKAYHKSCLSEHVKNSSGGSSTSASSSSSRHWSCPRHSCWECGKHQTADGAIFACWSCPIAYCLDCLDPRYLDDLDPATGMELLHVASRYPGMDEEGMPTRRSLYYISCPQCNGVLTDDDDDDEDEDEETQASNDDDADADEE